MLKNTLLQEYKNNDLKNEIHFLINNLKQSDENGI